MAQDRRAVRVDFAKFWAGRPRGVPEVGVSRCVLVLVDQSTEDVAAAQLTNGRCTQRISTTDRTGVVWAKLWCGRR
jgi:hypothetical protein